MSLQLRVYWRNFDTKCPKVVERDLYFGPFFAFSPCFDEV